MEMTITVNPISALFQKITDYLIEMDCQTIYIETDYYLLIPTDKWTNLEEQETVVGSMCDDLSELQKVVRGDAPLSSIDLDRVATVLREVSQLINPV